MTVGGTGRPAIAPGSWGIVRTSRTDRGWLARTRVRRLDGSYGEVTRTAASEAAAQEAVASAAAEQARGAIGSSSLSPRSTFTALVDDWAAAERQAERIRPQTLQEQLRLACNELVPRLGNVTIREFTVPVCETAYRSMLEPRRVKDRNGREHGEPRVMAPLARNAMSVLRKILDRAVTLGLRTENPCAPVRLKRKARPQIRALDTDGMQLIRQAVSNYLDREDRMGPRMKHLELALDIMIGTGARIGEALAIRALEDIDLFATPLVIHLRGTIVDYQGACAVRQSFPKTSTSIRSVTAPRWLDAAIRSWLSDPAHADWDLLLQTRTGRPVSPDRIQSNLRAVRAWAGLPEWVVPHVMRKSAATVITAEHGTDHGMWLLGHADTRVLEAHYDKRGTVPYSITQALEPFGPAGISPQQAAAKHAPTQELLDGALEGAAAAMGIAVSELPQTIRDRVEHAVRTRNRDRATQ